MSPRVWRFLKLAGFSLGLTLLLAGVILPMGVSYMAVYGLTHHACGNQATDLTQLIPSAESIQLSPQDDPQVVLEGWFVAGTNGAGVIVLGGAFGGRNNMSQEVQFLHTTGYSVLIYDTRSCANPPQITSLGYTETADLRASVDYMTQRPEIDPDRIGVFGFSAGAATAIMGAAHDDRIAAVVAVGNYAYLRDNVGQYDGQQPSYMERWLRFWMELFFQQQTGVDPRIASPLREVGKISPRPVFLIHGTEELPYTRGQEQFEAAHDPKALWIVPNAGHGQYIEKVGNDYAQRIIAFLDRYLLNEP